MDSYFLPDEISLIYLFYGISLPTLIFTKLFTVSTISYLKVNNGRGGGGAWDHLFSPLLKIIVMCLFYDLLFYVYFYVTAAYIV